VLVVVVVVLLTAQLLLALMQDGISHLVMWDKQEVRLKVPPEQTQKQEVRQAVAAVLDTKRE
jgi:hypothetical protein